MDSTEFTVLNVLNGLNTLYTGSEKVEKDQANRLLERFQKSVSDREREQDEAMY